MCVFNNNNYNSSSMFNTNSTTMYSNNTLRYNSINHYNNNNNYNNHSKSLFSFSMYTNCNNNSCPMSTAK